MPNQLSPTGLVYSRNKIGAAPTYQAQLLYIANGYTGSAIGKGDLVQLSGVPPYVTIAPFSATAATGLGVFITCLPFYDVNLQATSHGGPFGSYAISAAPAAGQNVPCLVVTDPFALFRVQLIGALPASWQGYNANFTSGSNGAPSSNGLSTLSVTTIATTSGLPLRIEGLAGVVGGPQDPTQTNPWLEVSLNPAWAYMLQGTGV